MLPVDICSCPFSQHSHGLTINAIKLKQRQDCDRSLCERCQCQSDIVSGLCRAKACTMSPSLQTSRFCRKNIGQTL